MHLPLVLNTDSEQSTKPIIPISCTKNKGEAIDHPILGKCIKKKVQVVKCLDFTEKKLINSFLNQIINLLLPTVKWLLINHFIFIFYT